jgi:hypothetical protein
MVQFHNLETIEFLEALLVVLLLEEVDLQEVYLTFLVQLHQLMVVLPQQEQVLSEEVILLECLLLRAAVVVVVQQQVQVYHRLAALVVLEPIA